ncbi:hypothetical protein LQE96_05780 [Phocea massiliensis]|jgi:hypothetical protein|uniref:hypothetical protein n=1 Tax=Merdimmobilis hominis TaxID=2897707 RepID=UPI00137918C3|nr:hypothetical protein [Merdimmobilis hominis]MCD4836334.1 hypothetical protein [Merdimmobilis hominis]
MEEQKSRSHWLHPHHGANYPAARSSLKIRRKLAEINEGITAAAKTSKGAAAVLGHGAFSMPFFYGTGPKSTQRGTFAPSGE